MSFSHGNDHAEIDRWPTTPSGTDWDGTSLLTLLEMGQSPFRHAWDVRALIREIEANLCARVTDIPLVTFGANHYGLQITLSNRPTVVARLSRGTIANPHFRQSPAFQEQLHHTRFELATYKALLSLSAIFRRGPVYHRGPDTTRGIDSRWLFVFEKAEGVKYDYAQWRALSTRQKAHLLVRSAHAAAMLFKFKLPEEFICDWLRSRMLGPACHDLLLPIEPTRDFCMALLAAKVESTFANHDSLPARTRAENNALFRFVLDHGDFGIHNMTISLDSKGNPAITSVFDWEAGSIVPALLSEPKMIVTVDLVVDRDGAATISRWGDGDTPVKMDEYMRWSREYYKALFGLVPRYKWAIESAKDVRYMWFALRDCQHGEVQRRLEGLGAWAQGKLAELELAEFA